MNGCLLTWTHVGVAADGEVLAPLMGGCQPEVCDVDFGSICIAEEVLGFEITMINAGFVTSCQAIDDLKKDALHPLCVSDECLSVGEEVKEIAARAIL